MNIEQKKVDDLNLKLTLAISKEDYQEAEKKKLGDKRKNAEFKGFRKGMVPMSLIQKVYGEQALVEAINSIIYSSLDKYIKDNNLHILGEPLGSDDQPEVEWKSGNDFTFKFDLGLSPEIKMEVSKDDKVVYYNIGITEAAKKEMKENILRQFGSMQEGDKVKEDDYIIADFVNAADVKSENSYVAMRSVADGSKKVFLGKKAGDKFSINVNEAFTNDTDRAALLKIKKDALEGLDPVFDVSIVNVKTFVPAEANQDTFDKAFGKDKVHNDEEFDKEIEARLEENYKQEADYRLSKDIKTYLLNKAKLNLPEEFLKRWLLYINEGKFTKEQIEKEFDSFAEDFRWQLVRSYFMEKFNLKVEEKDIHEAAEGFVAYQYAMYGMGNVPHEMIHQAAHQMLSDEKQVRRLEEQVEDQKVFAAIREVVSLQNKKITVEKFRELK